MKYLLKVFWFVQSAVILLVALLFSWTNWANGCAALLGGLTVLVSNALFAGLFFKRRGARAARQIVKAFYRGEMVKWLVSIAIFVMAFKWLNVPALPFFVGFVVAQMVFWIAPFIVKKV